jgi:hypothetical protein
MNTTTYLFSALKCKWPLYLKKCFCEKSVPYNASAVTDDKRLLKYSFFPEICPMGKSLKKIFRWCNIHRMENTSCCLIWPKAIILIYWNVIFIWETGYWTRAMKRFALIDLLKCLYSDTNILSKYIPSLQKK